MLLQLLKLEHSIISEQLLLLTCRSLLKKPSDATLAAAYTFNPSSYYLNKIVTVYASEITKANIFSLLEL